MSVDVRQRSLISFFFLEHNAIGINPRLGRKTKWAQMHKYSTTFISFCFFIWQRLFLCYNIIGGGKGDALLSYRCLIPRHFFIF